MNDVKAYDDYFIQKKGCNGRLGLSSIQKMTTAIRILAYGCAANHCDEYIKIGESTATEALMTFCKAVISVCGEEYMRPLNEVDIARLFQEGKERGFPGMFGSIDYMYWEWKNCPVAWSGMAHIKDTLICLCSYWRRLPQKICGSGMHSLECLVHTMILMCWIILWYSPVFDSIVIGQISPVNFIVNGHYHTIGYYLSNDIYLKWATLMQTIPHLTTAKEQLFAQRQEACKKDLK
ncbi:uncharacterized protein LOC132309328 [Cornus florida]|uniref:uncharacterized protein LOC132309328 n=1 Tax=Cornus florida TaxID=4283 RepID=UPI002897FDF5|nr:uncharacterized protein LOC132309328 [Cornus florida]